METFVKKSKARPIEPKATLSLGDEASHPKGCKEIGHPTSGGVR